MQPNKKIPTPKEIVEFLDQHIVGQKAAKESVAIALCSRQWRKMVKPEELRNEIYPKNILMKGPTGVGKTELARRLAKLIEAPFHRVNATTYTEVGFVGRDVESIIRDLVDVAVKLQRANSIKKIAPQAELMVEERILDSLLPPPPKSDDIGEMEQSNIITKETFRKKLRNGELDDKEVSINVAQHIGVEIMAPPGMEELTNQFQSLFQNASSDRKKRKKLKVKDAKRILHQEESLKLIDEEEVKRIAIKLVEESGIVFIDEIDKVSQRSGGVGADVSREGVQRDLLPLIEGCAVSTKYGTVHTDHILFIASGAFHLSKPADLIPELQGRLPIRVELEALRIEDFKKILIEPNASLTKQYQAMLEVADVKIEFTNDGIDKLAQIAWEANDRAENIGARRLHTVMEQLLQNISFNIEEYTGKKIIIDEAYVTSQLGKLIKDYDLSKFIL